MRIALVTIALMFAACGAKAHEPQVHQVAIRGMQFVPADLSVAVGDTIVWTNEDIVAHTVTAAGVFDSQSLSSKQQWQYKVATAGEVDYVCNFHPTMKARIVAH